MTVNTEKVADFLVKQCSVSLVAWENSTRLLYAQIIQANVSLRFQASSNCLPLIDLHPQHKSVGTKTFFRCAFLVLRFLLAGICSRFLLTPFFDHWEGLILFSSEAQSLHSTVCLQLS